MRRVIARYFLDRFSARYSYDASYLRAMLNVSPTAFFRFAAVAKLAGHREAAPIDAYYAAKLTGALHEDCGPCVQLVVNMAREAGVADSDIAAMLAGDPKQLGDDAALGLRFAAALTRGTEDLDAARDAVRDRWGEAGIIDLTFGAQVSRLFPMVKKGTGHAHACERIRVGERSIAPRRAA